MKFNCEYMLTSQELKNGYNQCILIGHNYLLAREYMRIKSIFFTFFISLLAMPTFFFGTVHSSMNFWPGNSQECGVSLSIDVAPGDYVYKEHLSISTDNPAITVAIDAIKTPTLNHYDAEFNETKKAFEGNVDIMVGLSAPNFDQIDSAHLHVSYYLASKGKVIEEIVPLTFQKQEPLNDVTTQIDVPNSEPQTIEDQPQSTQEKKSNSWLSMITNTIEHSDSWTFRILLIFLLGLLMSLTPCIYPMIPITAGILQTQESRSLIMSFFLALSYTFGLATTFAILGLLAAFAGQAMGQLMYQPWFIIPLVLLLLYLAFSMMGFYEMYIPRFMQPRGHNVKGGSFISVFIFGAISGIVASPCLSPGLVCLLCMVTTWGNALLGFVTLFAFGLGLSVPLLVIGTFSNSLSLLPRAGMWMVEIKKLFGLFMIFMCVYFLIPLFAEPVMAWILAAIVFACGLLLIYFARHTHSKGWRFFYNLIGVLTVAFGVYCTYAAYVITYIKPQLQQTSTAHEWENNYATARHRATDKLMFVDIGAPYCSICKSIDAKLLHNPQVEEYLKQNFFPVKINGGNAANDYVLNQFHVMGFPTILLVNPKTEEVIKRWGPELNDVSPEAFIQELKNIR